MFHAFVEYETVEDAEKAVVELNDERNWRSGLRVRLLHTCMGIKACLTEHRVRLSEKFGSHPLLEWIFCME
ncbi:putative la-related protein 6B [Iris pallida]|uniref:La-related protein 6B n=1 Tax=Iris pallida TaxID=29817 RepID=A0AAX6H7A1_IRIPA|nr:putative la-related protein 6B [Iris pallida]